MPPCRFPFFPRFVLLTCNIGRPLAGLRPLSRPCRFLTILILSSSVSLVSASLDTIDGLAGPLPKVEDTALHILSPTLLELVKINTKPAGGPVNSWNFVDANGTFQAPPVSRFKVTVNGKPAFVYAGKDLSADRSTPPLRYATCALTTDSICSCKRH